MNTDVREPSWLTAMADQRIATFKEALGGPMLTQFDVLQMALTEPDDEGDKAFQRWDQSCDNCKKYMVGKLFCRHIERQLDNVKAIITVGACADCWRLP